MLHEWHKPNAHLSETGARTAVDELIRRAGGRKALTITFFGGEALLNFEVIRATDAYAERAGQVAGKLFGFTLTTSGTLLTDEIINFFVNKEFAVMVSLDGDKEAHDRYRVDAGGHGTHDREVSGVRRLLEKQRGAGVLPLKPGCMGRRNRSGGCRRLARRALHYADGR